MSDSIKHTTGESEDNKNNEETREKSGKWIAAAGIGALLGVAAVGAASWFIMKDWNAERERSVYQEQLDGNKSTRIMARSNDEIKLDKKDSCIAEKNPNANDGPGCVTNDGTTFSTPVIKPLETEIDLHSEKYDETDDEKSSEKSREVMISDVNKRKTQGETISSPSESCKTKEIFSEENCECIENTWLLVDKKN